MVSVDLSHNLKAHEFMWAGTGQTLGTTPIGYQNFAGPAPGERFNVYNHGATERPFWRYLFIKDDKTVWTNRYFATAEEAHAYALADDLRPAKASLRWITMRGLGEFIVDGLMIEAFIHPWNDQWSLQAYGMFFGPFYSPRHALDEAVRLYAKHGEVD